MSEQLPQDTKPEIYVKIKIEDITIDENDDFIAINKPSGLLTVPDREGKTISLKQMLKEKFGNIFTVHRLDRDTSGIVVFAKHEQSHRELSQLFENRATTKIYNGFIIGTPDPAEGEINEPLAEHPVKKGTMRVFAKGKESITRYRLLKNFRMYSWMEFTILTGRTHQIRVHMKHLGHPIVCDEVYGDGKPVLLSSLKKKFNLAKNEESERPIMARLALHSSRLGFQLNGKQFDLEAEVPKDLRAFLNQLKKNTKKPG